MSTIVRLSALTTMATMISAKTDITLKSDDGDDLDRFDDVHGFDVDNDDVEEIRKVVLRHAVDAQLNLN